MDIKNLFHTRTTYNLQRLDYVALFFFSVVVALAHAREIRWTAFAAAMLYPDLLGYIPGAVRYYLLTKGNPKRVPKAYYLLYNTTHCIATNVAVLVTWYFVHGGWEWAMMALPIHFTFDRGIFGNIYKPFGVSFEPVAHPQFVAFDKEYQRRGDW